MGFEGLSPSFCAQRRKMEIIPQNPSQVFDHTTAFAEGGCTQSYLQEAFGVRVGKASRPGHKLLSCCLHNLQCVALISQRVGSCCGKPNGSNESARIVSQFQIATCRGQCTIEVLCLQLCCQRFQLCCCDEAAAERCRACWSCLLLLRAALLCCDLFPECIDVRCRGEQQWQCFHILNLPEDQSCSCREEQAMCCVYEMLAIPIANHAHHIGSSQRDHGTHSAWRCLTLDHGIVDSLANLRRI